jgi:chromate transporter
MPSVPLRRVVALFLRLGAFTFGGGDPTMAAFYTEAVTARQWVAPETYGLVYALARITPGTNLIAFGAGLAWELGGWIGALVCVLAMSLPAAFLTALLTIGYERWKSNPTAMAAIAGVLAGAVGLIVTSVWQLLARDLRSRRPRIVARALTIAGGALLLGVRFGTPPIAVLGLAAAAGWAWQADA